ncbi:hypothetical protein MOF05_19950 [Bacillus haynesii]|uniref:coiled-coil domain-containing protein n=1 Tax=Bacillus haynesii TaxID=1925021 RepID=UPI002281560D|nr:hypothetical protein [Bacillus haynesii]MCY9290649.1 hypothetical protein [Bacillus haynesii]
MESLMLIGFLSFLFSICYLVFHLIKRIFSPGKRFSKKLFYPCFAGGLLLLIISAPYYDEETYAVDKTKTEDLTVELQELKTEHSALQKEQTALKQQVKQANEKLKAVKSENDTLKNENEKLTKEKNAAAQAGTSHSAPAAKKSSAESKQECKIKGSVNHIYHTPGSTYYDRTKNVARWFCTEQEALDAGYRPPKR